MWSLSPIAQKYYRRYGCVELSETVYDPIGVDTLKGWKQASGDASDEPFDWFVGASRWIGCEPLDEESAPPHGLSRRDVGLFRATAGNAQLWAETSAMAAALSATGVLFKTPVGFSPSQINRDAMAAFFRDTVGEVPYACLWEPRGLWEADDAAELAASIGLLLVRDPYAEGQLPEPPAGDAYYALTAPSGRAYFSEDDFFDLADWFAEHEGNVWAVFRGNDRGFTAEAFIKALERA